MAEGSENVISWNFPNVVTIWLMVALLWIVLGMASHALRRGRSASGVKSDNAGNLVA